MLFEAYSAANIANYAVSLAQLGNSTIYEGNFPTWISNGTYDLIGKQQVGGAPAESDPTIGSEDGFGWTGSARVGPSDVATSGQLSLFAPIRLARGVMITNFPVYLKSSID